MREIIPGIWHWTTFRDTIGMDVSSYWVEPAGIVVDPMVPPDAGLDWWDDRDVKPQAAVLTIGLHWRDCDAFAERFGCPVRVASSALSRFEGTDRKAEGFAFGDEIATGVTAIEVGGIAPDETALHIALGDGAMAVGDGVIQQKKGGDYEFVPDFLMGDDPEGVKKGLRTGFERLVELEWEALLPAHGEPVASGGRDVLRAFLS